MIRWKNEIVYLTRVPDGTGISAVMRASFYGTLLGGQQVQRVRWRRGIGAVEGELGELLGQIYAQRFFPPANQAAMNDLVANLRKAMGANLAELAL